MYASIFKTAIEKAAMPALVMAGIAALTGAALAQAAPPAVQEAPAPILLPKLTKQAKPSTGPVQPGDVVDYVLTYDYGNLPAGAVHIVDKLSNGLTYFAGSLSALGWSHGTPPYIGNAETYTNLNPGPAKSFMVNVPVGSASNPSVMGGGDGFRPIPVGGNVYAVNHHLDPPAAQIMCWNRATFAPCWSGAKSLGPDIMTPTVIRHEVVGTRIYYPAAQVAGSGSTATTTPGIGCWETTVDAPCPFIPIPGGPVWTGPFFSSLPSRLDPFLAGIAWDAARGRFLMYAVDSASAPTAGQVYCVPVPSSGGTCGGWALSTPLAMSANLSTSVADLMIEEAGPGGSPTRLYVTHAGNVSCRFLANGAPCWSNVATNMSGLSLSPYMASPTVMTRVCFHPTSGVARCLDAANGSSSTPPAFAAAMATLSAQYVFSPFLIPGTTQVLYPMGRSGVTGKDPMCFDTGAGGQCPPSIFTPAWPAGTNWDYGYAVDPDAPDRCFLGFGDFGVLWRFARDGGYGKTGCTEKVRQTLDLDGLFCSVKPKEVTWASINLLNAPPELSPNSPITLSQGGQPFWSGTVGQAVNGAIPVNKATLLSQGPVTLDFAPAYNGQPKNGYQVQVTFASDVDPQICYTATVQCGVVSNSATVAIDKKPIGDPHIVDLGTATGPTCPSENAGLLKVCKVAGSGIAVGTPFVFTAGNSTVSVPAGPPPGGTCTVISTFPVGSHVVVQEQTPPGDTVAGIVVTSPKQIVGQPNLAGGSVEVTIGAGVTVVTFTNKRTGYIEICKRGEGTGSFTVNPGALGPFVVAAGTCTPPIEVAAGTVTIGEAQGSGVAMADCGTFPPGRDRGCNPDKQTFAVDVVPGDVSSETVAFITNRRSRGGAANERARPPLSSPRP